MKETHYEDENLDSRVTFTSNIVLQKYSTKRTTPLNTRSHSVDPEVIKISMTRALPQRQGTHLPPHFFPRNGELTRVDFVGVVVLC